MERAKIFFTIFICLFLAGAFFYNHPPEAPVVENTAAPELDPSADAYKAPEEESNEISGVSIPGWKQLNLKADQTTATVDFYNPEVNEGKYYLTFEIQLDNEILYTSGLIEPGLHIQEITLSRPLKAGTYDAIIHVQPYRMDKTPTNNANMQTTLVVK